MIAAGSVSGASGGTGPSIAAAAPPDEEGGHSARGRAGRQPSRAGTKAITVHFPEEVRRQLKAMAGEQGRDVSDMVAEAFNILFAKYHKPELAPRKSYK